jgi:hypothetical protein
MPRLPIENLRPSSISYGAGLNELELSFAIRPWANTPRLGVWVAADTTSESARLRLLDNAVFQLTEANGRCETLHLQRGSMAVGGGVFLVLAGATGKRRLWLAWSPPRERRLARWRRRLFKLQNQELIIWS